MGNIDVSPTTVHNLLPFTAAAFLRFSLPPEILCVVMDFLFLSCPSTVLACTHVWRCIVDYCRQLHFENLTVTRKRSISLLEYFESTDTHRPHVKHLILESTVPSNERRFPDAFVPILRILPNIETIVLRGPNVVFSCTYMAELGAELRSMSERPKLKSVSISVDGDMFRWFLKIPKLTTLRLWCPSAFRNKPPPRTVAALPKLRELHVTSFRRDLAMTSMWMDLSQLEILSIESLCPGYRVNEHDWVNEYLLPSAKCLRTLIYSPTDRVVQDARADKLQLRMLPNLASLTLNLSDRTEIIPLDDALAWVRRILTSAYPGQNIVDLRIVLDLVKRQSIIRMDNALYRLDRCLQSESSPRVENLAIVLRKQCHHTAYPDGYFSVERLPILQKSTELSIDTV